MRTFWYIVTLFVALFAPVLKAENSLYPWELICKVFDSNTLLFEGQKDSARFDISKNLDLVFSELFGEGYSGSKMLVQKWDNQGWKTDSSQNVGLSGDKATLFTAKKNPGFYKISLMSTASDSTKKEYFFIVCPGWQDELFSYCQTQKQALETQADSQSIKESILLSHYNNLMEELSKTAFLANGVLERLSNALKSRQLIGQGQMPFFAKGLNKLRFKRFPGADYTDIVIHMPKDYDSSKRWPVYVYVDSAMWYVNKYGGYRTNSIANFHPGMIDIWWHSAPGLKSSLYTDLKWKEFMYVKKVMEEYLNIDSDRFYLFGECENGVSAMALSSNFPDTWAHCSIGGGNSYRYLIGNMKNTEIVYSADHDYQERVTDCNFCVKCFQYFNCQKYKFVLNDRMLARKSRNEVIEHHPKEIHFTIENMQNPRAYWVTILGREDENYTARINALVKGQEILINTKNVDAYAIDMKSAPVNHIKPVEIIENGKSYTANSEDIFIHKSKKYENAKLIKNSRLHGPVRDVFTDAYTVLYTQGKDDNDTALIKSIAQQIAGTGPCISENECNDGIIKSHNIIVVGKIIDSSLMKRLSGELPVQVQLNQIVYENNTVQGDAGLIMIYPNPLNTDRYLALFVAVSDLALKEIPMLWGNKVSSANADITLFKVASEGKSEIIRLENFNTIWKWHDQWGVPLAKMSKEHPKWQWRQWIAYVIRKQMNVDVVIDEEAFEVEIPHFQTITLRDLNQAIANQWIIKIKLSGKELKSLLMQSVNKPKGTAISPVVEGIAFLKNVADSDRLHLSDLQDTAYYTVAMPYKAINGIRIGVALQDYEIVGEEYLLPILYQYLKKNENLQIDEELDKMRLTIL